ncbi:hypothetical protein Tco_0648705 [Tanacetum coccineum]
MTDEQNPQQPPLPTQQDQPESPKSPITYDPASQVDYNPDQINIKPNIEVALFYPKHNNSDYFLVVSDFIFKSKANIKIGNVSFSSPTGSTKGEVGVTPFSNAIRANYLSHSKEYDEPPTQELVKQFFPITRKKKSGTSKDKNPSQPSVSTLVVIELHKEAQQATSGPASLGVIGKVKANPQLSSVKSTPNHEPVFLASIIIHYEFASGHDASADSTTEADPRKSDPKDLLSQQQEFDASPEFTTSSDEVNDEIKLEDLRELLKDKSNEPIDLDTLEDNQPFRVVSENEEEIQTKAHAKTEDTSSQNIKMEKEKEAAFISAQPSFPNVQHLIKLLVKSLKPELSQLLTGYDFSSSIPTKLKELPSKISDINGAVGEIKKYVEELEVKTPGELKDLLGKLEEF